jgi:hypothetical protein
VLLIPVFDLFIFCLIFRDSLFYLTVFAYYILFNIFLTVPILLVFVCVSPSCVIPFMAPEDVCNEGMKYVGQNE